MTIESTTIATNRYAPEGANSINLYGDELAGGLTLTQLIQQTCLRAAAAQEAQSVVKMNMMTANTMILEEAADWLRLVVNDDADWNTLKPFLIKSLRMKSSDLPADIDSFDNRMKVAKAIEDKMSSMSQNQQQDMIDLQTMVNRRDVAYSTSASVVRADGQSTMQEAQNYL